MRDKTSTKRALTPSSTPPLKSDVDSIMRAFVNHLEYSLAKDEYSATSLDFYKSLALTLRDFLFER
jgi:hypothetical protein